MIVLWATWLVDITQKLDKAIGIVQALEELIAKMEKERTLETLKSLEKKCLNHYPKSATVNWIDPWF